MSREAFEIYSFLFTIRQFLLLKQVSMLKLNNNYTTKLTYSSGRCVAMSSCDSGSMRLNVISVFSSSLFCFDFQSYANECCPLNMNEIPMNDKISYTYTINLHKFYAHGELRTLNPKFYTCTLNAKLCTLNTKAYTLNTKVYTLNAKPYTLNAKPYFLNATPCFLNATPYTLNAKPYTLNAKPYTLNAKLYTLNAKLYTLNDKLYTLNAKLYTLNAILNVKLYTLNALLIDLIARCIVSSSFQYHKV